MATRTVPFCLEMLAFCHPKSSWHTRVSHSTRGGHMATRTVPFCLEMLTFCHPKSSGTLRNALDAGRVTGHSHTAFLLGNAYILPPRELRRTRVHSTDSSTQGGHVATRTVPFCLESSYRALEL